MQYQDFIKTELLILVPVLNFIGIGLKKSRLPDQCIPALLGLISMILSAMYVFSTTDISHFGQWAAATFSAITQGILIAGTSVYANQLYKQSGKDNHDG